MSGPSCNVELKADDPDRQRSLEVCRAIGAADRGVLLQRDTYFRVERGQLKLREETPGHPHLIQYERADHIDPRPSAYRIVGVADGAALCAVLAAALGVRGVVEKRRHLFQWRNVRIHLDSVAGLGDFIEFEAVAEPGSDLHEEHRLVAELRETFSIADDRLRAGGYASQLGL